jgi:hypothetical protein
MLPEGSPRRKHVNVNPSDFSPFHLGFGTAMVAVAPFAMVVAVVLIVVIASYQVRRLKSRERLTALEKGLPIPEYSVNPRQAAAKTRRTAFVLIGIGVGTALAFALLAWILQQRSVLSVAAFAVIPFVIGVGLFIDYRLQARALTAAEGGNGSGQLSD